MGFVTNVTCGLTAKKPGSAPCLMLVIEYGTTFTFYLTIWSNWHLSNVKLLLFSSDMLLIVAVIRLIFDHVR